MKKYNRPTHGFHRAGGTTTVPPEKRTIVHCSTFSKARTGDYKVRAGGVIEYDAQSPAERRASKKLEAKIVSDRYVAECRRHLEEHYESVRREQAHRTIYIK